MEIRVEDSCSKYFSSEDDYPKSSSNTSEIEMGRCKMINTVIASTPEDSKTNSVPTDLSKNTSTSKLATAAVERLEIYYTTPGRIISPKIERIYENSKSSVSSSGFEVSSSYSELTPPPSATLPAIEEITYEPTRLAPELSDGLHISAPSCNELEKTISASGWYKYYKIYNLSVCNTSSNIFFINLK